MNSKEKKNNLPSIKIKYEFQQDKSVKPQYTHGVWGGINPHGELEMNFYTEYDKLPQSTECELSPEGIISPEDEGLDQAVKHFVRDIHSKLVMNVATAKGIMDWIGEQLEMMENSELEEDELIMKAKLSSRDN